MNRQPGQTISCRPAPSAPPTSVSTSDVTSSSITVQWGAVDCIHRNGDITGYSVRYGVQGSGSTQMLSVSGSATTEATISGLESATNYSIEVAAVNSAGTGVYSAPLTALNSSEMFRHHTNIHFITVFISIRVFINAIFTVGAPEVTVNSTTATTISLSWTSAGSVVDSYEVTWERDTSGECPDEDEGSTTITDGSTSYNITGLEEDSNYTITVNATNAAGSAVSDTITGSTGEGGEREKDTDKQWC